MLQLNTHEAKTHLSRYLPALEHGETILLCKRNVPIAEIRPLPNTPAQPRPFGLVADYGVELPAEFFEPLPDELLAAFNGVFPEIAATATSPPGSLRPDADLPSDCPQFDYFDAGRSYSDLSGADRLVKPGKGNGMAGSFNSRRINSGNR